MIVEDGFIPYRKSVEEAMRVMVDDLLVGELDWGSRLDGVCPDWTVRAHQSLVFHVERFGCDGILDWIMEESVDHGGCSFLRS